MNGILAELNAKDHGRAFVTSQTDSRQTLWPTTGRAGTTEVDRRALEEEIALKLEVLSLMKLPRPMQRDDRIHKSFAFLFGFPNRRFPA